MIHRGDVAARMRRLGSFAVSGVRTIVNITVQELAALDSFVL